MKRLFWSLGLLGVMVAFCWFSSHRVNRICQDCSTLLRQAETQCTLGRYGDAADTVQLSRIYWQKHEAFLGIALRHTEADDIDLMYPGLIASAAQQDPDEFFLRNGELLEALRSLSRMEQPYIFNIL